MKYGGKSVALGRRSFLQPELELVSDSLARLARFSLTQAACFGADWEWLTDRVVLHYQPEIDLRTGEPIGVEALLRWRGRGGTLVAPEDFLASVRPVQRLLALDLHVLDKAIRQSVDWAARGIVPAVSVNITAGNLESASFVEKVERLLARFPGFDPGNLVIEILESVAIKNLRAAAANIRRLRQYGIRFYLDDFGTGHSSAAYLKHLPVDAIKLDRMFARDIPRGPDSAQDIAIIEATVLIAKAFGLPVIAEGVETRDAAAEVKRLGCQIAQGYFFTPPLPEEELIAWYGRFTNTAGAGAASEA
jgi:EAL domain-containing protein (putative c-di-GMP-specific phosphodiesterase class I)